MSKLPNKLKLLIQGYSEGGKPVSEHEVADAIRAKFRELEEAGDVVTLEVNAEWMAFSFMADYPNEQTAWGTYFGPMMVWKTKAGKFVPSPDIQNVSAEVLAYWRERLREVNHPVLRARYADLVWDFSKIVTGKAAEVVCAQSAIDSYLVVLANKLYEHSITAIAYAKRALELSISLNDKQRVGQATDAIILLENQISEVDKLGTWGFAFDLLVTEKRARLAAERCQVLVGNLEKILSDVATAADTKKPMDPFIGEHAAMRLAAYYRRINQLADAHRVIRLYAKPFLLLSKNAGAMLAHGWLRQVYYVFHQYGMTEDAEELAVQLGELGQKSTEQMQTFTHEFEIPIAEVEEFVRRLVNGNLEDVLGRFAAYFTPDPQKVEEQVKKLAAIAPLSSLLTTTITGRDGRDIAEVGSTDDDLDGRVVLQTAQNLQIEGLFLRKAIEELVKRFQLDSQKLLDQLYKSPLFEAGRRNTLKNGIDAFFAGDHITAIHILIPQIENALRRLLVLCRRPTFKVGRQGGQDLRLFDEILRDPAIVEVFSIRVIAYLRVLLTDRRGWNLRNNVCHGISEPDELGQSTSDRIIHVLFILGNLREKETS